MSPTGPPPGEHVSLFTLSVVVLTLYHLSDSGIGFDVVSMAEFFEDSWGYRDLTMRRILKGEWKKQVYEGLKSLGT